MIWKRLRHPGTLGVLKDPGEGEKKRKKTSNNNKKSLTGIKANGDGGESRKIKTGVGSLATPLSETSNHDDAAAGGGLLPGHGSAAGAGASAQETALPTAGPEEEEAGAGSLSALRRGRGCRAHPHAHTPEASPALPRGRPQVSP